MNITAYAEEVDFQSNGANQFLVIDAAQSVGKKYPVVIASVTVLKGFLHYVGDRYSTHNGVTAVIAPRMQEGPNHRETIKRVLREGIANGRDDRR
jgi:hypothetical protein